MKTIDDIKIPSESWVDLNTLSGISVGTPFDIQNKTTVWVQLYEGDDQPTSDEVDGRIMTNLGHSYGVATVLSGSLKIWAKAKPQSGLLSATISVQEL